ncbi:NAD-dependent epimerase [Bacillus sp. 2205SS5-2]|uniref:NAD-dependent epimerase n=1 Tax=Bacillus sp. 2205SS5-2 TaxID=3109031 RepID=UPI003004A899
MIRPIDRILVTGCAGFIGFHFSKRLLEEGIAVVGVDNINDYYDQTLKFDRLRLLKKDSNFQFKKGSIENIPFMDGVFAESEFDAVVHLAAQAGVRYSIENPYAYVQSNVMGFTTMLECCKNYRINHLLYASSSSVYGANKKIPFSTHDRVDHPVSFYAATKKANEAMASTYSHIYQLPTTGLRFFTVYGPMGRPDMAYYSFTNKMIKNEPIDLYNNGKMKRDFTYIDDVVESIYRLLIKGPSNDTPYQLYNIGNNHPIALEYFVKLIEENIGLKAEKNYLPMQPGDVEETYADIDELSQAIGYQPTTSIEKGIKSFIKWYKEYYKLE